MQSQITALLEKEMDRKEFLRIVGAGLVGIVGLGALSGVVLPKNTSSNAPGGYGTSAYGGYSKTKSR